MVFNEQAPDQPLAVWTYVWNAGDMQTAMRTLILGVVATIALPAQPADAQTSITSPAWLDQAEPAAWNRAGSSIPAAPDKTGPADAKCRAQARPPQIEEDRQVQAKGWDLIGAYQGGWQMVVVHAAASYDGMCRPMQYQHFVFVEGTFAGTLSPQPMDSRADGSLSRVWLQGPGRLAAEYQRYTEKDPLCCPSATTTVEFEIPEGSPVVRPTTSTTTKP